jgi:hypothetical protein
LTLARGPKRNGEIVIRGRGVRRAYGPFRRTARRYIVRYQQSRAVRLSASTEPRRVANSIATLVSAADLEGQATATVPWPKFWVWVSAAAPSYVLRLTPER